MGASFSRILTLSKKQKAFLVDWMDSASEPGWMLPEQLDSSAVICQSIGFFVQETKDVLTLALNRGLKNSARPFGDLIHIPKVSILKRRKINMKKKTKRKSKSKMKKRSMKRGKRM